MSLDRYYEDDVDEAEEQDLASPRVAPGKRTLTARLLAGLDGERGRPLAEAAGEAAPDAAGARVVTGPRAAAAAEALGAEAFTVGDRIFFGEGAFQPSSPHGRALLDHELAHVAQQGGTTVTGSIADLPVAAGGSAVEQEADRAAEGGGSPQLGGGSPVIARKSIDDQVVPASVYASMNARDLARGLYASLTPRQLPFPAAHASWLEGSGLFWRQLMIALTAGDSGEFVSDLQRLVLPSDLFQLIDSGRAMTGTRKGGGGTTEVGPLRWSQYVAVAVADVLYQRVHAGLARVAPRYLAVRARAGQARPDGDQGGTWPEPDAKRILASHPADRLIAQVLCRGGLVDIDTAAYREGRAANDGPRDEEPVEVAEVGDPSAVKWRFLDDPRSPNWIEVTEPAEASRELVAAAVLRTRLAAHRVQASPPFFGLSLEDAADLRRKQGIDTAMSGHSWLGSIAGPVTPEAEHALDVERDPAFGLLRGDRADQAALAQAGGSEGTVADRGGLLKTLERTRLQIALAREQARPLGLARGLGEVEQQVLARLAHFATAPDQEIATWQLHAEKQHDVVFGAMLGLEQLGRQLAALGIDDPGKLRQLPRPVRQPVEQVGTKLVDVIALSHLVELARERLEAAELHLRLAPLETLELMLDEVRSKLEVIRGVGYEQTDWLGYRKMNTGGEAEVLRQEIAEVRAMVIAQDPAAGERIRALHQRAEDLQVRTDIAANYFVYSQIGSVFHELRWDSWTVAAFQDDDADSFSEEAGLYTARLKHAWGQYQDAYTAEDEAERQDRITAAQASLQEIFQDEKFQSFLKRAYAEIDDIQTKVAIAKIAAIIGIALVSMGAGSAIGGAAAGALRLGATGTFVATATAEAAVFTGLDRVVFGGGDMAGNFASELAVNLGTFGLLRAWRAGKVARHADEGLAAARLEDATRVEKLRGYLFKGAALTAEGLIVAATAFVQIQYDSLRQRGEFVGVQDLQEMGKQGLAMVVAIAVGGRVLDTELRALQRAGGAAGERARAYLELKRMAADVEVRKDPQMALELLRRDRALMQQELDELAGAARGPDAAQAQRARYQQHQLGLQMGRLDTAELSLALDELVPGRHYMGTPEQLAPLLDRFRAQGAEVATTTVVTDGRRRHDVTHGERRVTLHEAQHVTSTGSRGNLVEPRTTMFEANSVVGHVPNARQGHDILRRLAANDRSALAELGYDFPAGMATSSVEWGLGRRFDGAIAVVVGTGTHVDWGVLPHIVPLAHSHPLTKAALLKGADGAGELSIRDLVQDRSMPADLTTLFPSAADFGYMAQLGVRGHVVHTPYVHRGGDRVGNPAPAGETAPTVDFVIERSTYVGRWAAAEDVGVYRAQVTARAGGQVLWRGEVYAVEAGFSMLSFTRPGLSARRLPIPRGQTTASGAGDPQLAAELEAIGVTGASSDPDVQRVLSAFDEEAKGHLRGLIAMQRTGAVAGLTDWLAFVTKKGSAADIGRTIIELREARTTAALHPGAVVHVGGDLHAPRRPGTAQETLPSFDLTVRDRAGTVVQSVEVTTVAGPVNRPADIKKAVDHAGDKAMERERAGIPVEGRKEARIELQLAVGTHALGGGATRTVEPDGTITARRPDGSLTVQTRTPNPHNLFDAIEQHLPKIDSAASLDVIRLVGRDGAQLATYERGAGGWSRVE